MAAGAGIEWTRGHLEPDRGTRPDFGRIGEFMNSGKCPATVFAAGPRLRLTPLSGLCSEV